MLSPVLEKNVFETILARRSVRSYAPQPVADSALNTLLEAAVWAPTAMHREPWGFVIVKNKLILQSISELAKVLLRQQAKRNQTCASANPQAGSIFFDAPTLIIVCGRIHHHSCDADCWMAAQNLMLAACALHLGTCVVTDALPAISLPKSKQMLGIPENYTAISPIAVGYPGGGVNPSSRKSPIILNTIA